MPYLRVRIASENQEVGIQKMAQKLTELAVNDLGKVADVAVVDIQYVNPKNWFVGGKSSAELGETGFFLEIKITEATNLREQKAQFVKNVFGEFTNWFGTLSKASYVVVQDIDSDSWGYGGKTQEYRYISKAND